MKIKIILFGLALIFLFSCNKNKNETYPCMTPPEPVRFCYDQIENKELVATTKKANILPLDSLTIFYYKNGIKYPIQHLIYITKSDKGKDKIVVEIRNSSGAISWHGESTIYYSTSAHQVDTIITSINEKNAKNCTYFETDYVKYNGKELVIDQSTWAYIIE